MKIKVAAGTLEEAKEVKSAQNGLKSFSKAVELGHDYRLILRVSPKSIAAGKPSLLSASLPIRKLERFVKGSIYILEDWDIDEMTGRYIDKTPIAPYENISRVIHKAEAAREKIKKERELNNDAIDSGIDVNSQDFISKRAIEINKIDLKYFGDKDTKTYATVHQLVGPITTYTCAEMYLIPCDAGVPDYNKAELVSFDITSASRLQKLINVFKSVYQPGDQFVELSIKYGYGCQDNKAAGQALSFDIVKPEDRLSATTPEKWAEFAPNLEQIAISPEQVASRSTAARYNNTASALIAALKEYVSRVPNMFHNLDFEDNTVKYSAQDLLNSGIVSEKTVQERLLAIVQETAGDATVVEAKEAEDKAAAEDFDASAVAKAGTIDELAEAVTNTSSTGDLSALDSGDIADI